MVKIKICGIKSKYEIMFLNKYLPDYVGFVFAKSKRKVTPDKANQLIKLLDNKIIPVGIFVNEPIEKLSDIIKLSGIKVVQLCGDEDDIYIYTLKNKTGVEIWKSNRISNNLKNLSKACDINLLDTYDKNLYGGSGNSFDWNIVKKIGKNQKIILAGGINKDNVIKAIDLICPYAVDISSSLETDNFKDENKVKEFISTVRGGYRA